MKLLVISDTHLRNGRWLPAAVDAAVNEADAVLHAGDVTERYVLDRLAERAPTYAVRGNNDVDLDLPERLTLVLDGVEIAMVHDSGPARGRSGRLAGMFPTAAAVVFGHSHIPWDETAPGGQLHFNPGSPTQRRAQPAPTFGQIGLQAGRVVGHRIVRIGDR